ncbi:uncharacterized protein LOC107415739 isoform X1 [Ziziphus jujuba]|uniref:Uncharacterized protein LOC107415739 isoform X1 n=1 Tax=Ziziphus jujuba TaxID=326968 RepID=A0A6P3ZIQ0_ZIZJJ|nr:uncharacterized protein LOC107415739 isoform X1 [Ziziphus jujuba]
MASSSPHKSLLHENSCHVVEEEEQQEALDQDYDDDHQGWLRLGLGLGVGFGSTRALKTSQQQQHNSSSNPLFPYSATTTTTQSVSSSSFCLSTQFQAHHHHHHNQVIRQSGVGFGNEGVRREVDLMKLQPNNNSSTNNYHNLWANYKNDDHEILLPSSSSSWPWHMESSDQARCLGVYDDDDDHDWQMPVDYSSSSSNIKISTRPNSGLWFTLSASTNRREREGGGGLPQVPKAYIRVKDENVTVSMVKKYLVRKLGLSNEAEIDVYCMGQKLVHTQSLKQVRDGVWLPRLVESVNSAAGADERTTADCHHILTYHLLSLHYGRTCL